MIRNCEQMRLSFRSKEPGEKLIATISSPIQVHGVTKVPARRAPEIVEHNEEVLREIGFTENDIDGLRASSSEPL